MNIVQFQFTEDKELFFLDGDGRIHGAVFDPISFTWKDEEGNLLGSDIPSMFRTLNSRP